MSDLLHWCASRHPDAVERAGPLVFIEPSVALELIDRAESAGVSIERLRGFTVADGRAVPIAGQDLSPSLDLLDCETPSSSSCGQARRALRGQWIDQAPPDGRHMVLVDVTEGA